MAAERVPKLLEIGDQDKKLNDIAIEFRINTDMSVANSDNVNEANTTPPLKINEGIGDVSEEVKLKRCLRPRSSPYYGIFDFSSDEESDCERTAKVCLKNSSKYLRKKINTSRSSNKSKYEEETPRWIPEEGRRPLIDEAPIFYPTEEEFKDALAYISKIREEAEHIGICRIIPPSSWSPPCPLKERTFYENVMFTTRLQQVDKLQNREPTRKNSRNRCQRKRKRRKRLRFGMTRGRNSTAVTESTACVGSDTDEKFGFQSGSDFTLDMFERYADEFKRQYFCMKDTDGNSALNDMEHDQRCKPSIEDIEGEYWRIVEDQADEIEVHYGADLDTGVFASGFPKASTKNITEMDPYVQSGWNLNNLPRLPGSVLSFEKENVSGVLVPWLYVGMCFSSFCWHVEDHHLYSLNYMHFGDAKVWYGVPGSAAMKLEEAMRKHLPDLFEEQPNLLHELVTQLSPSILKTEGVPVYRAIQNPGEFVMTFPRAYHSGFNSGFNCAEAVNVAPVDWLPYGQCAVELYSEQHRKTSVSHDKILFGTAKKAVKELYGSSHLSAGSPRLMRWQNFCGKNGTLTAAIKARVTMEHRRRESVSDILNVRNMNKDFDLSTERECFACFYDLHLSAVGCECSPNRYACLSHANALCTCESRKKFVLARYDLEKLDTLVAALEGDLSSMKHCGLQEDGHELPESASVTEQTKNCLTEPRRPLIDINVTDTFHNANNHDNPKEVFKDHPVIVEDKRCIRFEEHACTSGCLGDEYILTNRQLECSKYIGTGNCTKIRDPVARDAAPEVDMHKIEVKCEEPSSGQVNLLLNANKCKSQLLFSDPNGALTFLEPNVETEKYGDHGNSTKAAMTRIMEQDISIHGVSKHKCQFDSSIMYSDGHISGRTQIELEAMRKGDKFTETKLDCGSSGLQYPCTDLVFPKTCAYRTVNVGSFSRDSDYPQKTCPKLFGVELQRPCSSSTASGIQRSSPTLSYRSITYDQSILRTSKVMSVPKYSVEPLNFGKVLQGSLWCDEQAIFPKGFRSRVNFISVLDPMKTCYYISEVLEVGPTEPLFKVTVEDKPDVSFINSSALRCWEMVRQKLNQEIFRLNYYGNQDLPLLTPELLDGLEMFGFRSPPIVNAIEAMDPYHLCSEYWLSKLNPSSSTVHVKVEAPKLDGTPDNVIDTNSYHKKRKLFGGDLVKNEEAPSELEEVESVSRGLFQKASLEELTMMQKILCSKSRSSNWQAAYDTLLDEIRKNVHRK